MQSGERIVIDDRDYRLETVLSTGAGSYGQVWAATDAAGHAVALKFINTEAMSQADPSLRGHWRAHLEREIVFLASLDADRSRHIVALLDHGWVDDQPVLVLERLSANLGQWLARQRRDGAPSPDLGRILDWADQILAGLDVIHRAGFVYRDLKFSNLLVGDDGTLLKLADFGSLKRADGDSTRSFIGTPATMAPEQLLPVRQGADGCEYRVDYRADYYALGLLLFALLTEQPATTAQRRLGQLLALHGQEGAGQHREQLGGLSDEEREQLRRSIEFWTIPVSTVPGGGTAAPLTELIARLLARDPADRPRDSAEIRAVLDAVRAGQPIPPAIAPPPTALASAPDWEVSPPAAPPNRHPRRPSPSSRPAWSRRTAGLAGVLGLAGAIAWAIIQPTGSPRQDLAEPLSAVIAPSPPAAGHDLPAPVVEPPPKPATIAAPTAAKPPAPESPAAPEPWRADGSTASAATAPRIEPPAAPPTPEPMAASPASGDGDNGPTAPAVVVAPPGHAVPAVEKRSAPAPARKSPGEKTVKTAPPPVAEPATSPRPPPVPPAAPLIAKPAPKPPAPAILRNSSPTAKTITAGDRPTSAQAARATRTASATRPPSGPTRPTTASPVARSDSPSSARSHPQPAQPSLPPLELESRPRPAPPAQPPIKLVSRSDPGSVMTPARPAPPVTAPPRSAPPAPADVSTPRRSPDSSSSPPARATDPITQFREDAGRTATDIRREAEAVGNWLSHAGKEIQRGLDSANQAINDWTGNCNPAHGCNQSSRVERRDRWSDPHGAGTPSRYERSAPDVDEGFAEPPPRRPQYYR